MIKHGAFWTVSREIAKIKLTATPTNASLSTRDGSIARWKCPTDESPAFSSVTEVLTLVSWVERSIFRETSLKTSLELKSSFPRVQDARSKAATAARRREKRFILRWKRILKDDYVEPRQWVQRKEENDWAEFHLQRYSGLPQKYSHQSFAFEIGKRMGYKLSLFFF